VEDRSRRPISDKPVDARSQPDYRR